MDYIYNQLQGRALNGSIVLSNGNYRKIGIQVEPGTIVNLNNGNKIIVGITGRLELEEVKITSLSLSGSKNNYISYIIDYYKYN